MQIYENRNDAPYRSGPTCGYCKEEGHNRYQCKMVADHWSYWKDYVVPPTTAGRYYWGRDYPKYWGEWYDSCKTLYAEQQKRSKAPKQTKKRSTPRCGFCGSLNHNRRHCDEMKNYLQKCYRANENWRRAAYKELVGRHGICVGACIEVKKKNGWSVNAAILSEIGVITKVNFDSLNIMAAKNGYFSGNQNPYYCELKVRAMIDGEEEDVRIRTSGCSHRFNDDFKAIEIDNNIVLKPSSNYYSNWTLTKLISPSEHPIDEKWVTDYRGAFDLLLKKRSKSQLDCDGVTSLINKWAKKD